MSRRNPELRQQLESLHLKFRKDELASPTQLTSPHHGEASDAESPTKRAQRPKSAYIDAFRGRGSLLRRIDPEGEGSTSEVVAQRPSTASLRKSASAALVTHHSHSSPSSQNHHGNVGGTGSNQNPSGSSNNPNANLNTQGGNNGGEQARRSERAIPSSMTVYKSATKSFMKIRIIPDDEAEKTVYIPHSDMMHLLFQKSELKVYIGPTSHKGQTPLDERLLTRSEYLDIEDMVDVELNEVKNTLMPAAYKRIRKQKINERIAEHFDRLNAIKQNMERMDRLLHGYEVKSQGNLVDVLNLDDISELVLKDLATREGAISQTKQIVESISEENKKITKEKHNLLQDLTNWFNTHGIDVETLQTHSVESDDPNLLRELEDTPFEHSLRESQSQLRSRKQKLESIFSDYKSMKDETREEEKRKYLSEFERKIQHLEASLVGQVDDLDDAESKIQLLLKKILYLTEELEEEKDLHEEKARQSIEYRRKFLQYKGLLLRIITRLQEPRIREAVDVRYIITGRYMETILNSIEDPGYDEDDLEELDLSHIVGREEDFLLGDDQPPPQKLKADDKPPELRRKRQSMSDDTQSDVVVSVADNAMWFTQGEDVETPENYILDFVSQPLHQLTPLEVKLRTQVDYLTERIRIMEMERFESTNFDANMFAKTNGTFEEKNKLLLQEIASLEQTVEHLKGTIADKDSTIISQSELLKKAAVSVDSVIRNEIEEFEDDRRRSSTLASMNVVKSDTAVKKSSLPEPVEKPKEVSEPEITATSDSARRKSTPSTSDPTTIHKPAVPSSLELVQGEKNYETEEDDEQRRKRRNENYILQQQREELLREINAERATPSTETKWKNDVVSSHPDSHVIKESKKDSKQKKELKKKKVQKVVVNENEEKRVKERNKAIIDESADDLNVLFDKNSEEYTSTDDILKTLDSLTDIQRLRGISKLLVVDRENIIENFYGTHQRSRKFFEFLTQLFSNKSQQAVYSESDFISDWITFNRKLDSELSIHTVTRGKKEAERRPVKRMTLREELKYQTTYAIDNEREERRRKNNPGALTKSVLGILAKMYLHLKVFMRRKMNSTNEHRASPSRSVRPSTAEATRAKSATIKRKRKPKAESFAPSRMENHQLKMKERWEEKKRQILWEQRNRFASYSLMNTRPISERLSPIMETREMEMESHLSSLNNSVTPPIPRTSSSGSLFDVPPTLDMESIETKRKLSSISPRHATSSPRPRSSSRSKRQVNIDLSLGGDELWNANDVWDGVS